MHQVAEHFDVIIWRSLRDLPDYGVLLDSLLQTVAPHGLGKENNNLEQRQSRLMDSLRSHRVLLVLDNLESVLQEGKSAGHFLPEYEGLGRFLQLSAETEHQSCVLITSREKSIDLVAQEGSRSPVRALRLARLGVEACEKLLEEKEAKGSAVERARLIEIYTGNPLAVSYTHLTLPTIYSV